MRIQVYKNFPLSKIRGVENECSYSSDLESPCSQQENGAGISLNQAFLRYPSAGILMILLSFAFKVNFPDPQNRGRNGELMPIKVSTCFLSEGNAS